MTAELVDRTYAFVRGFNYVPSTAATIWDVVDHFDPELWDREVGWSTRFGTNTIRIWCDHLSFYRDEERFLDVWRQALDIAGRHGIRLMPTLANRWTSALWPFGQVDLATVLRGAPPSEYARYVETFVGTFRDDERVLMWDLCNEPFTVPKSGGPFVQELQAREMGFWRGVAEAARGAGPSQPITLGILEEPHHYPAEVHDIVDVISCHVYQGWWDGGAGFADTCDRYVRLANEYGKPLVCSETLQGSLSNETRTEIIAASLRTLEERGIGWLAWQLMAGEMQTSRWDRPDPNCRPGDGGVHYFVERDGTTRPGHAESDWRRW